MLDALDQAAVSVTVLEPRIRKIDVYLRNRCRCEKVIQRGLGMGIQDTDVRKFAAPDRAFGLRQADVGDLQPEDVRFWMLARQMAQILAVAKANFEDEWPLLRAVMPEDLRPVGRPGKKC